MSFALILEKIVGFFGTPFGRWILIGLMLFLAAGACELDGMRRQAASDAKEARAQHQEDLHLASVAAAKLQGELDKVHADFTARIAEDERILRGALEWASGTIKAMEKERENYVADSSSRVCPSVTVGYLVFRSRVSDIANGRNPAAAIPPRELADAPAGLSLRELAVTDAAQAGAYGTCRARDAAWAKHVDELEGYAAKLHKLLNP